MGQIALKSLCFFGIISVFHIVLFKKTINYRISRKTIIIYFGLRQIFEILINRQFHS